MSASQLTTGLESLAKALEDQGYQTQFTDQWGWQGAPFSAKDLAAMSRQIARDIGSIDWTKATAATTARLGDLATRVDKARTSIVPSLNGGYMALDAVINTIIGVDILVRGLVSDDVVVTTLKPSSTLGRRIKLANDQLDSATQKIAGLDEATGRIIRAAEAAEMLDVTTAELNDAAKFVSATKESVLKSQLAAEAAARDASELSASLRSYEKSAEAILKKANLAYGAATTVGLASSFDDKARELNSSMGVWVVVLIGALFLSVLVGQDRFPQLMEALRDKPDWGVVLMYMTISSLSLGPGVWLAWVATKQIGQRFRLAEDYGYKASLAKAYEGYRSEAENMDPLFTAQLFSIALGRLEELPLRTIARDVAGSPLNDLLQSEQFKAQMEKSPELREIIIGLLQRVLPKGAIDKTPKRGADKDLQPSKESSEA